MRTSRSVLSCVAGLTMCLAAQLLYHSPAIAGQPEKVEICHFPPHNQANYQTITITANALASHLAHGDFPGPCADDCTLFASVCDDHNPCTVDTCNPDGTCKNSEPIDCNDSNPCTTDACDPTTGDCTNTPNTGAACDDTNDCTGSDTCNAMGQCAGTPITGCCTSNTDCDDTNLCTTDTCTNHTCSNTPVDCNDNNACTADTCVDGLCVNAAVLCDDNNQCTNDSCNVATGCVYEAVSCDAGESCDPTSGQCVPPCTVPGGPGWQNQVLTNVEYANISGPSSAQECCQSCLDNLNCDHWLFIQVIGLCAQNSGASCSNPTSSFPNAGTIRCP